MNKNRIIEIATVVISSVASILITFLGTKFISKSLGPTKYGELSIYLTFLNIPIMVFSGPFSNAVSRYVDIALTNKKGKNLEFDILNYSNRFLLIVSIIFFCLLIYCFLKTNLNLALIITLLYLQSVSFIYFQNIITVLSTLRMRLISALGSNFDKIGKYIVAAFAIFLVNTDVATILFCFTIASFFSLGLGIFFYFKNIKPIYKTHEYDSLFSYSNDLKNYAYPFLIWGLIIWVQNSSEKWILNYFTNEASVGIYSIYNQIGFQTFVLGTSVLSAYLLPILYQKVNQNNKKFAYQINNKITVIISILGILAVIFSYLFKENLILLLSSNEYIGYSHLLPIITLGGVLFVLSQNMCNIPILALRTELLIWPKISTGIVGIVSNFVLIKHYQLEGLSYALVITNLFFFLYLYYINNYRIEKE
jgi:O-antigen/teichoic acid export membrane protein